MAKKTKTTDAPQSAMTLAELTTKYAERMEHDGKSAGTVASYLAELKLAQSELGADKPIAEITPDDVHVFYNCARVTLLRSGRPKSQLSIDKTRRVLRLALAHAVERGWLAQTQLPGMAAEDATPAKQPRGSKRAVTLEVPQPEAERVADEIAPTLTEPAA